MVAVSNKQFFCHHCLSAWVSQFLYEELGTQHSSDLIALIEASPHVASDLGDPWPYSEISTLQLQQPHHYTQQGIWTEWMPWAICTIVLS